MRNPLGLALQQGQQLNQGCVVSLALGRQGSNFKEAAAAQQALRPLPGHACKPVAHHLLAHGQHMAVGVLFGIEGVGHGWRREDQQRRLTTVDLPIEVEIDRAALQHVQLEEAVMPVRRGISAKKIGEPGKGFVVDFAFRVAPVIDPADVDIGNRLCVLMIHGWPYATETRNEQA